MKQRILLNSAVSGTLTLPVAQGLGPQATRFYKSGLTTLGPHGFYIYLYKHKLIYKLLRNSKIAELFKKLARVNANKHAKQTQSG